MSLLALDSVKAAYGTALALHDMTFAIDDGEAVALLGRNGMGKTSTMRCIMRLRDPHIVGGSLRLEGHDIAASNAVDAARAGLGYVPQGRRVFRSLTATENLEVGAANRRGAQPRWTKEGVFELFPQLASRARSFAGRLSGGEQQMLAIGRALMSDPKILLLDEPSEGLAPAVVDDVLAALRNIHAEGVTILLAEQDLALAAALCERFVVVDTGSTVLDVDRESFLANDDLQASLLGLGTGTGAELEA